MCVSVTALAATYLVFMSKVRRFTVTCRLLTYKSTVMYVCFISCGGGGGGGGGLRGAW